MSSDGLLIALSEGLDRSSADRLAAVAAGLLSIAKGGAAPIGGGRVHEVIVEMDQAMLFVMRVSDTSVLAVTTTADPATSAWSATRWRCSSRNARRLSPPASSPSCRPRCRGRRSDDRARQPFERGAGPSAPHGRAAVRADARADHVVARRVRAPRAGARAHHVRPAGQRATPEDRSIIEICQTPTSVAELSARLTVPVGVVRVLIGDLVDAGMVTRAPGRETAPSTATCVCSNGCWRVSVHSEPVDGRPCRCR